MIAIDEAVARQFVLITVELETKTREQVLQALKDSQEQQQIQSKAAKAVGQQLDDMMKKIEKSKEEFETKYERMNNTYDDFDSDVIEAKKKRATETAHLDKTRLEIDKSLNLVDNTKAILEANTQSWLIALQTQHAKLSDNFQTEFLKANMEILEKRLAAVDSIAVHSRHVTSGPSAAKIEKLEREVVELRETVQALKVGVDHLELA
jgi:hypothetical protein